MLITFQSPAYADVMLFGEVAEKMLEIISKEFSDKGIITVENLPAAIASLKAAISAGIQLKVQRATESDDEEPVGIPQRALPLVDLFEASLTNRVPVVWGV